eukprot:TRINITY_DN28072_c0_g1_i1.p2 TRINITY_DN28072_c0_g1~~TRINITY_DN28072_c0_g1_i1.p2  ORF type:complete len:327 (+),score=129.74 TRINITY_DN28072_c0_g1_i1:59-982(+)
MAAKAAAKALPIPPYTWSPLKLAKVSVYGAKGKFRTERLDAVGTGAVMISDSALRNQAVHAKKQLQQDPTAFMFPAPKKLGFSDCPACGHFHMELTRRCTACGESMVYYPTPDASAKKALQTLAGRSVKIKATTEASKARKDTADNDKQATNSPAATAVRSSTAYFLYATYNLATPAEVEAAEHAARHIEQHLNTKRYRPDETVRLLTTMLYTGGERRFAAHGADMTPFVRRPHAAEKSEEELFLSCVAALFADAGSVQGVQSALKHKEEACGVADAADAKYLKDAWMNSSYNAQSAMVKIDRLEKM